MNREREFIVDACVVRIMKSRKTMKYNELIPEVIKLINNFKAEIQLIKRRVESLIERDYINRDPNDRYAIIHFLSLLTLITTRNTFVYMP